MGTTTKKLQIDIELDATGAIKGIKGLGKESDKLVKDALSNNSKMKKSWASTITGINQGLELAKKAFGAFKKVFDLNKEFLKYRQGMDALARNTGQNADVMVAKLKEVSDGTVANKDLMLAANRAVALNVTKDIGQMSQLMEISRLKAKAMGIDTTQAFNDMVTGIGRGSPLILDNLGIITKGWAEEAKAAGQAMDAQFILNKVLKDGAVEIEKAGEMGITGAERIAILAASFDNLMLAIGGFLKSDAVKGFIEFATEIIAGATDAIESWSLFGTLLSKSQQTFIRTGEILGANAEEGLRWRDTMVQTAKSIIVLKSKVDSLNTTIDANKGSTEDLAMARENLIVATQLLEEDEEKFELLLKQTGLTSLENAEKFIEANNIIRVEMQATAEKETEISAVKKEEKDAELEDELTRMIELAVAKDDQAAADLLREQQSLETRLALMKSSNDLFVGLESERTLQIALLDEQLQTNLQAQRDLTLERDKIRQQLSLEFMGTSWENLTIKQQMELEKMRVQSDEIFGEIGRRVESTTLGFVDNWAAGMGEMIIEGTKLKTTLGGFFKGLLKQLGKMIIKMAAVKAAKALLTGGVGLFFKEGGQVPKMAGGGKLSGPSHSQGGIPIEAEGGEYFVKKDKVTAETLPILQAINSGISNLAGMSMPPIQKFAEGGTVNNNSNSTQNQTANIGKVQIVSPNPRKLFNQFVGYASDMGVNLLRR